MYTGKLIKKEGKLTYAHPKDKLAYELFLQKLQEGQEVEMYIDLANADHSRAQINKVHACIRELAKESGYTFEEMKKIVKERSGLCYTDSEGEFCKSFADCSSDELMMAIQAAIEIGSQNYNMSLQ
jgi:7-cyano-7-deazaguanine synthase in queuosine biosynthesis